METVLCRRPVISLNLLPRARTSLGLSAKQPAVLFFHTKSAPATSQSAVLFSHNKSAPAISHNQTNTASSIDGAPHLCHRELYPWSYFLKDVSLRFQKRCVFLSECNSYHRYRIGIELHKLQMFSEGSLAVVVEHHYIWANIDLTSATICALSLAQH